MVVSKFPRPLPWTHLCIEYQLYVLKIPTFYDVLKIQLNLIILGIQLDPNRQRIYAEFQTTLGQNDRVLNKVAVLYLFAPYLAKIWKLILNLKSFEVMHGLSRVALLVPDKLATAIAINKENLPDPDDGGFLVQLVIDLVIFYRDQLSRPANHPLQEDDTENIASRVEELGGETQQSFR